MAFTGPQVYPGLVVWNDAGKNTESDNTTLTTWTNFGSGGTVNCNGVILTNQLNGLRVLRMNTSQRWNMVTEVNLSAYSFFLVSRQIGGTNGRMFQGRTNNQLYGYWGGYKRSLYIDNDPNYLIAANAASDTQWDFFSHTRRAGSSYTFDWNGSSLNSGSSSTTNNMTGLAINEGENGGEKSDCDIAEVILYNSVLTLTQTRIIEGYLAWKWGLQGNLPSTHPYKTRSSLVIIETVPRSIPNGISIVPVNTISSIKTITMPIVSTNNGRLLIFKDFLGNSSANPIYLSTIGLDRIENNTSDSAILSRDYAAWTFLNDGGTRWFLINVYANTLPLIGIGILQTNLPATPSIYLIATQYSGTGAWIDNSPNARNATLENGTIAKNATGNGIVLNGSTNWIFNDVNVGNAWTLSVWYKNTGSIVGSNPCIVTQNYIGAQINICLGFGAVQGFSYHVPPWYNGTSITITNAAWTHYTGTWNGTTLTTYINGVFVGSTTPGGTSSSAGSQYRIGRRWDNPDYMVGEIGEVRIYPIAISAEQVATDYNYTSRFYV